MYVCIKWCKKTLLPFINSQHLSKFVLLLDNEKGQMLTNADKDDFKESVFSINGLLRYNLPDGTDLWQPVDAGYAALLQLSTRSGWI